MRADAERMADMLMALVVEVNDNFDLSARKLSAAVLFLASSPDEGLSFLRNLSIAPWNLMEIHEMVPA